ncbi:uncharacterized protein LOC142324022 [Lycorma delicatula]|uniref:uncharacterized protein LOC142324022 n=1 Tax=Lycorma delicatula TaxID=130591 RepID=UPI003F512665
MADILISPKVDSKIRNRNAAYRKKFGSHNFRDILRQRCKERIKARRGALFDHLRPLNSEDEVRSALSDMMHSDVKDISTNKLIPKTEVESMDTSQLRSNLDNQEELRLDFENESNDDEERYLMEMYEQLLESEQAMIDALLEDELICPLCEKGVFKNISGFLTCTQCPATLHSSASPSNIKSLINSGLSTHNQFCSEQATFAIFSEDTMRGLFMICDSCAYFIQII